MKINMSPGKREKCSTYLISLDMKMTHTTQIAVLSCCISELRPAVTCQKRYTMAKSKAKAELVRVVWNTAKVLHGWRL